MELWVVQEALLYKETSRLDKDGKGFYEWHNYKENTGYKGKYSNEAYNGKGTFIFTSGDTYKGEYRNNSVTSCASLYYEATL